VLSGGGEFEVAEGARLVNTQNDVIDSAVGVTVNGGTIISSGNAAVSAIYMHNPSGWVSIGGGSVRRTAGGGFAVFSAAPVYVSGGEVSATTGVAIHSDTAEAVVSGGVVFAYGDGITGYGNVIFTSPVFTGATGEGVVIAWDQGAGKTVYSIGSDEHISMSPATATVVWARQDGKNGIAYTNGSNTGFIEVDGITLADALQGSVSITGTAVYGATLRRAHQA